jgi:hypothetical protein
MSGYVTSSPAVRSPITRKMASFCVRFQEMMAVARSSWKADAGARPNGFATRVGHKHELPLYHVNELVLLRMRVSRRRLTIGQNPNKVDAVILEPRMIAEASGIALALSLPERLGIAGCVALRHIGWPECLRSSCHGPLLTDREDCKY